MNIEEAREAFETLFPEGDYNLHHGSPEQEAYRLLDSFISEVETLLKYNSIKQTPALFKEKK